MGKKERTQLPEFCFFPLPPFWVEWEHQWQPMSWGSSQEDEGQHGKDGRLDGEIGWILTTWLNYWQDLEYVHLDVLIWEKGPIIFFTASPKCNLHSIDFSCHKYTVQWVLVKMNRAVSHHNPLFPSTYFRSASIPSTSPGQTLINCLSLNLPFLGISYK